MSSIAASKYVQNLCSFGNADNQSRVGVPISDVQGGEHQVVKEPSRYLYAVTTVKGYFYYFFLFLTWPLLTPHDFKAHMAVSTREYMSEFSITAVFF